MRIRAVALVMMGLLAAVVAGCGDSDADDADTSFGAELAREANAICAEANRKVAPEFLAAYNLPEVKKSYFEGEAISLEARFFVPIMIVEAEELADGIRALPAPSESKAQVGAMADAYDSWVREAKASAREVVAAHNIFNQARGLAEEQGLDECARTPYSAPSSKT